MIHLMSKEATTQAKQILCFKNSRLYSKDMANKINSSSHPYRWLWLRPFYGGDSVVVDWLFIIAPMFGECFCGLYFVVQCLVSFLVCNHLAKEERAGCYTLIVFLFSWDCYCSVSLPYVRMSCVIHLPFSQSSRYEREFWLLYFNCPLGALWLLVVSVISSWCCGLVFSVWLWHFLVMRTVFHHSFSCMCLYQGNMNTLHQKSEWGVRVASKTDWRTDGPNNSVSVYFQTVRI